MYFKLVLISLFIYAILFNPNFFSVEKIQRHNILNALCSPQVYFLCVSLCFALFYADVKKLFKNYLSKNVLRNMSYGFLYALITPAFFAISMLIYSAYTYYSTGVWFIPWDGNSISPYSKLDLFFLWILAPISEELYFRGIIFDSLKKRNALHLAVIFSALLFMSTHGLYHLGSLVLGIAMAYATHFHKSLWPAITYHVAANMYVPIMCWYFPKSLELFEKFTQLFFYNSP